MDRVTGGLQRVIKSLGEADKKIDCLSGAAIHGVGIVAVIINPAKMRITKTPAVNFAS